MSMVSIKNFISPFTNTVHAVTIFLVTVLFALFRLQGGGVNANFNKNRVSYDNKIEIPAALEIENDSASQSLNSLIKPSSNLPDIRPPAKRIENTGKIEISEGENDLLQEMIGKKPLEEAPSKTVNSDGKKDNTGGLADIEKSLGLR